MEHWHVDDPLLGLEAYPLGLESLDLEPALSVLELVLLDPVLKAFQLAQLLRLAVVVPMEVVSLEVTTSSLPKGE